MEKYWVAAKRRMRHAGDAEPKPATWTDAAAHLHDTTNNPNGMVNWAWKVDMLTEPNAVLRLISPALLWSRTIDFSDGALFQFA